MSQICLYLDEDSRSKKLLQALQTQAQSYHLTSLFIVAILLNFNMIF